MRGPAAGVVAVFPLVLAFLRNAFMPKTPIQFAF